MKKFEAYHFSREDIISIMGSLGFEDCEFDAEKGNLYLGASNVDDSDDIHEALKKYFEETTGIKDPLYFSCDGDQPRFDVLVVPKDPNYNSWMERVIS